MNILKLREDTFSHAVSETERVLRSGGIIISPTDTVYGILGDATNESAVSKMFALKNRRLEKAFPVFVCDIAMARHYAYISDSKARFLQKVWPGPVTVVFHHKENLPNILTDGLDTIGLRIPHDPFLAELLKRTDAPIAQTSANISNKPPARNVTEIKDYFEKSETPLDLVIDGGELHGQPSTVVDFTGNEPLILRSGILTKHDFDLFLKMI